jgi:hypothetical protein
MEGFLALINEHCSSKAQNMLLKCVRVMAAVQVKVEKALNTGPVHSDGSN